MESVTSGYGPPMKPGGKQKVTAIEGRIRQAIFKREFQPGDALSEMHLARRHGLCRSMVREALG